MNLLLLEASELGPDGRVRLEGRRAEHLLGVLGVTVGSTLKTGIVGGGYGGSTVIGTGDGVVDLVVDVPDVSAVRPPIDLVLALPRPQALKRILEYAAMMGIGRIALIRAWRVEKSFFQSPLLKSEGLRRHLLLGAEQGVSTWLPEISLHRRFRPFLKGLTSRPDPPVGILTHPDAPQPIEEALSGDEVRGRLEVALGPEGGWIDREVESFVEAGFRPVRLGPWVLRVETALAAVLAQLEVMRRQASPR